jgi:hypothetical protein
LLILTRVLTLLISLQWISARSPTLKRLFTCAAMFDGIEQVKPATVIETCESAETVPLAALVSTPGFGRHVPGPTSTAEPPAELPSFPSVKPPPELKPAEMLASSLACGVRAWPLAKPAQWAEILPRSGSAQQECATKRSGAIRTGRFGVVTGQGDVLLQME